jgi:hypothetical protein
MSIKMPTDECLGDAIREAVERYTPRNTMSDYIKSTSRRLASLRESEIRDIEAAGGKVTHIEVGPDGKEMAVSDLKQKFFDIDVTIDLGLEDDMYPVKDQINIITGPHMYSDDCHCDHCSEVRAKENAGMHIDIEMVFNDAGLCRSAAVDAWIRGGYKGDKPDPVMSIPASVVAALCERRDNDKNAGPRNAAHWKRQYEIILSQADKWCEENHKLRAEIAELKEGTRTVNDVASSMFPGAVEGVNYESTEPGCIKASYQCMCGQKNTIRMVAARPIRTYACGCGMHRTIWRTP